MPKAKRVDLIRRPLERLSPALSPNGRLVHLARADGTPVCGSGVTVTCPVRARVTCPGCRAKRPQKTRRHEDRPHVVGVDWSPLYAALGRALATSSRRAPKVRYWPVLAGATNRRP